MWLIYFAFWFSIIQMIKNEPAFREDESVKTKVLSGFGMELIWDKCMPELREFKIYEQEAEIFLS